MKDADKNDLNKQLEIEGTVPDYLKTSLMSGIDLIKDTLQVVSLFGGVFFLSAFKAVTCLDEDSKPEEPGV